jgi:hypothetical protein
MSLTGVTLVWFYRPLLSSVLQFISSIYGIYKYVRETNHVSKVYSVVTIMWLQFIVHVILFSMLIFDTFVSVFPVVYVQCPIRLIYLLLLLLLALQPTMCFSLLSDFLPFHPLLANFPPPFYSHRLEIFFDIFNPSFSGSSSNSPPYWLTRLIYTVP